MPSIINSQKLVSELPKYCDGSYLANGKTVLKNCAIEPEVIDLINFLNNCGAKISLKIEQ